MIYQITLITYLLTMFFNYTTELVYNSYLSLNSYSNEIYNDYIDNYQLYKYQAIKILLIISCIINVMQYINYVNDSNNCSCKIKNKLV